MMSLLLTTDLLVVQAQDLPPVLADQFPVPGGTISVYTVPPPAVPGTTGYTAKPAVQTGTTVLQPQDLPRNHSGQPVSPGEAIGLPVSPWVELNPTSVKPQPVDERREALNRALQFSQRKMGLIAEGLKTGQITLDQYEDAKRRNLEARLELLTQYPDSLATDYPELFSLLGIHREAEKENLRTTLMQYLKSSIELLKEKPVQPLPARNLWKEVPSSHTAVAPEGDQSWDKLSGLRLLAAGNFDKAVLRKSGLNDSDLENLVESTTLEYIDLSDNVGITDASFVHFEKITSLKYVKLTGTSVTKEGIEEFRKKRPDVNIVL